MQLFLAAVPWRRLFSTYLTQSNKSRHILCMSWVIRSTLNKKYGCHWYTQYIVTSYYYWNCHLSKVVLWGLLNNTAYITCCTKGRFKIFWAIGSIFIEIIVFILFSNQKIPCILRKFNEFWINEKYWLSSWWLSLTRVKVVKGIYFQKMKSYFLAGLSHSCWNGHCSR